MFGIPGPLLEYSAPGSSLTYQNNESVWREFQAGCLSPYYLEPIEQAMSDLLTRSTVARFALAGLLRADSKTRWEIYEIATRVVGPEAADQIARQAEGLAPGNIDFAPVPLTPPSAIPTILPPDRLPQLRSEAVRCTNCNKLLAEVATPPYRMVCPRCKSVVHESVRTLEAPETPSLTEALLRIADRPAPNFTIHPPDITINPTFNVPPPTLKTRRVDRDEDGLITLVTEEEAS